MLVKYELKTLCHVLSSASMPKVIKSLFCSPNIILDKGCIELVFPALLFLQLTELHASWFTLLIAEKKLKATIIHQRFRGQKSFWFTTSHLRVLLNAVICTSCFDENSGLLLPQVNCCFHLNSIDYNDSCVMTVLWENCSKKPNQCAESQHVWLVHVE